MILVLLCGLHALRRIGEQMRTASFQNLALLIHGHTLCMRQIHLMYTHLDMSGPTSRCSPRPADVYFFLIHERFELFHLQLIHRPVEVGRATPLSWNKETQHSA